MEHLSRLNDAEGAIIIGAAIHPEMIDPAVPRADRFDHHVEVGVPTQKGIGMILEKQFKDTRENPKTLPERLLGCSGAHISAMNAYFSSPQTPPGAEP